MSIPLEDNYKDVLGKAQRGLGLADSVLADRAGIALESLKALKEGEVDELALRAVAGELDLDFPALLRLARGDYRPEVELPSGFAAFNTPFEDMTVNSYVAWDEKSRQAVAFDTGADCTELLYYLTARSLRLHKVLVTHAHTDHIFELDRLVERTAAKVFCPAREPVEDTESFVPGRVFSVGNLRIRSVLTNGHSPGGTSYVIEGLAVPVAVVGDSLFAGSMGGAGTTYTLALRNNRDKILTLPPETVIAPGHGPVTSVALERVHNPFYAGTRDGVTVAS